MFITYNIKNITEAAKCIIDNSFCRTMCFYGEVGSGKTTLIKSILKLLGVNEVVSSPTFSIINEYKFNQGILYHYDFYRINNNDEAINIGVDEYLQQDTYHFIEWPENINHLLPDTFTKIKIETNQDKTRTLKIEAHKQQLEI